jgi:hypothetical protein
MPKTTQFSVKINIPLDPGAAVLQNAVNQGKGQQMPAMPGFTTSYATVERALVRMHDIPADGIKTFRSRFGALQRGGMLSNQPGKGQKLVYGPDQIHRAVLTFELIELGLAPSIILSLIKQRWDDRLRGIFEKAEHANQHETSDVVLMLGFNAINSAAPTVNAMTLDKISQHITLALDGKSLPARGLLVNLSAVMRSFHDALGYYHLGPEPVIEAPRKAKGKRRPAKR